MRKCRKIIVMLISLLLILSILLPFSNEHAKAAAFDPEKGHENISLRFWNNEKPDTGFYINAASRYLLETVKKPSFGTSSGEWSVMDLVRGMYTGADYINYIPENYFTEYKTRIDAEVDRLKGDLDKNKSTEYSRLTLAMSALGYDIRKMGSEGQYDFVDKLSQSNKYSYRQGINGPIWELLALNTGGYSLVENPSTFSAKSDINSAGKMIDYIMNLEIIQANGIVGGWALMGKAPDPDITGMAIQGLALYYTEAIPYPKDAKTSFPEFKKAVERAIVQMSAMQVGTGGFNAWGNANAESLTQVIVALTALNMDPLSTNIYLPTIDRTVSFVGKGAVHDGVYTENMMDNLYTFWAWGSGSSPEVAGFKHVTTGYDGGGGSGTGVNAMATDQALYGLIAYDRFKKGEKPLYDMSDQINGEYKNMKAKKLNVTLVEKNNEVKEQYSPYGTLKIPATTTNKDKVVSWNTERDGSGVSYFPGELLSIPNHEITLYAQFDGRFFTINYPTDTVFITNQDYAKEYSNLEATDLPTAKEMARDGYQFVAWYDNQSFTGLPVAAVTKGANGDKKYYAKWIDLNSLVKEVISQINGLPTTVVASNKTMIENVANMYAVLTATQKLEVTNYGKLLDAQQQLKGALLSKSLMPTNAEKSLEVVSYIQAIPASEKITLDSQSIIKKARDVYNTLTLEQKSNVFNYRVLINAEKAISLFETIEVDQKAANNLIEAINSLPKKVTASSQQQIEVVRTAYDVMKAQQQDLVTNYNQLIQKEISLKVALSEAALQVKTVKNNTKSITGTTTPKAFVIAYVNRKEIGRAVTTDNGKFTVKIKPQKAHTKIIVKTSGTVTATKVVNVTTSKTLKTPKVNNLKSTQTVVRGSALKNTTVSVYTKGNKKLGTAVVNSKGSYQVKIVKQKKNTKLYVQIKDAMNNVSKKKTITVK